MGKTEKRAKMVIQPLSFPFRNRRGHKFVGQGCRLHECVYKRGIFFTVGDIMQWPPRLSHRPSLCVHCTAIASGSKLSITAIDDDPSTGSLMEAVYITFTAKRIVGDTTYVGVGKIYLSVNIYSCILRRSRRLMIPSQKISNRSRLVGLRMKQTSVVQKMIYRH